MTDIAGEIDAHIASGLGLDPEARELREDWYERGATLLRAIRADSDLQKRYGELAWKYSPGVYFSGQDTSDWPRRSVNVRAASMKEAIRILGAAAEEHRLVNGPATTPAAAVCDSSRVFIVYGHDHALRGEVERFLRAVTGHSPIVFDNESSLGSETIIEKLERLGDRAAFAVVLMTPDDVASSGADSGSEMRVRQNVLIELGWFAGRIGRGRVRILRHPNAAMPSDLHGVLYTSTDSNWKTGLAKDMRAAGLTVDLNALLD